MNGQHSQTVCFERSGITRQGGGLRWIAAAVLAMGTSGLAAAAEPSVPSDHPGTGKGMFIDTHVHFHDCRKGELEKVAEWMKANNVQRCINHPLSQSRPKNDAERQQMLANYAQYKGRIDRFCIIFPEEVNSVEEAVKLLAKEKQDGAIGFGEHYGVDLTFDDRKNLRLYEACAKVGLPVMFHMDRNKNLDEPGMPRLQRVLKAYPNLILIAHSDWWKHLADGTCDRLLQTYPNLYADVSCTVKRSIVGRDKEVARAFFVRHADKLLFGTDSGWWSFGKQPPPEFSLIDDLKLPKEVEDKICRKNAERLFWSGKAAETLVDRAQSRAMQQDAAERLEHRKTKEAKRAVEILKRVESLGRKDLKAKRTSRQLKETT